MRSGGKNDLPVRRREQPTQPTKARALWIALADTSSHRPRQRWVPLLLLGLLAGLLVFCHGCHPHDDTDDMLFGAGWWIRALFGN